MFIVFFVFRSIGCFCSIKIRYMRISALSAILQTKEVIRFDGKIPTSWFHFSNVRVLFFSEMKWSWRKRPFSNILCINFKPRRQSYKFSLKKTILVLISLTLCYLNLDKTIALIRSKLGQEFKTYLVVFFRKIIYL